MCQLFAADSPEKELSIFSRVYYLRLGVRCVLGAGQFENQGFAIA